MIHHTTRDPNGNLRYHQEHTQPVEHEAGLLPKSRQFADTTATLGIASRGFHFTGMTTDNEGHDRAIHSDSSLIYDPRQSNESFVENRSGAQANPAFKGELSVQTVQPAIDGTTFTASTAAPREQGGTGPSWIDRIRTNFRNGRNTQSTNLGTKPPEKFQIGLRSSNVKPAKADQKFPTGKGPDGTPDKVIGQSNVLSSGGVIGSVSR